MKILLVEPPYERFAGFRCEWYPMGLASIAAACRARGHAVAVYHAEHDPQAQYASIVKFSEQFNRYKQALETDAHPVWQEVSGVIAAFKPDVLGISIMTPKVPSALKIAALARRIAPGLVVVAGGQHPTLLADQILGAAEIDFAVRGEGEETFSELLTALAGNAKNFGAIAGLSYKSAGRIVHNAQRGLIGDLDALPMAARDALLDLATYTPVQLNMVMGSRGCPYRCGFCSSQNMWTRRVRYRSVANLMGEIRHIRRQHGVQNVTFMDDSFTVNKERVKALCAALREEARGLTWSCLTRVDMVSDEIIRLMKKAGCTKIDIGIESGNPRVLGLIRKDITLEQIRQAVGILRRNGMFWSGFFMFGFPTETEQEVRDTVR
ncbi:MAG TPA: radical SAM protein, partial [Candidatus Omnitrophota bacterium]|nr:radical SAM protein [Candidatus Omnitrophota bacterium]